MQRRGAMILERKAMALFRLWKETKTRQALLVTGARQVGKSYLIKRFCEQEYESVVYFDLVENAAAALSFSQAVSVDDLLFRMSVLAERPLGQAHSVVVFDEVQECPQIVTFVKYLVDRGDSDYILSGSLLGVALEGIRSLPVGYISEVRMYALDFEEFCWAHALPRDVFARLDGYMRAITPVPDFLHERLMQLFRTYLIVGGMPDAVVKYRQSNDATEVRTTQQDIHRLYREDIAKYAPVELRLVIRNIYELVPSQLLEENRRFKLSSIPDVKRFSAVQDNFLWLDNAGVTLCVPNVTQPIAPLLASEKRSLFKLFLSDVGLLTSTYVKQTANNILTGTHDVALGGMYENFVTQELVAHGFSVRYYSSKRIGELDALVETADGTVMVFEVKSGKGYKTHAALDNALKAWPSQHMAAFVLYNGNVERSGDVTYLPIYMIALFSSRS